MGPLGYASFRTLVSVSVSGAQGCTTAFSHWDRLCTCPYGTFPIMSSVSVPKKEVSSTYSDKLHNNGVDLLPGRFP